MNSDAPVNTHSMTDERTAMLERRKNIELQKKRIRMQGPHIISTVKDEGPRVHMSSIPNSNVNMNENDSKVNYVYESHAQPIKTYHQRPNYQPSGPKPDYRPTADSKNEPPIYSETKREHPRSHHHRPQNDVYHPPKSDYSDQRAGTSNVYTDSKLHDTPAGKHNQRVIDGDSRDFNVSGNMMDDSDNSDTYIPQEHISFRNIEEKKLFLSNPLPVRFGTVKCFILRKKTGFLLTDTVYELYFKDGNEYLLSSKKKPKNRTSNYYITCDKNDLGEAGASFLGKLRSNFSGTEFTLYGPGKNPKDTDEDVLNTNPTIIRDEKAVVMYEVNIFGSKGPRKMTVLIPKIISESKTFCWRPLKEKDGLSDRYKHNSLDNMIIFCNKDPKWNEKVGAYVLNFGGRVTMASVKNFQLVSPDDPDQVFLQFGKIAKDEFNMDFQHPLSPFQAFAICLSSFDTKLFCE